MNKKDLKSIISDIKTNGFIFFNIYSSTYDNEYIHSIYCTGKFTKDNIKELSHTYVYYDKQNKPDVIYREIPNI